MLFIIQNTVIVNRNADFFTKRIDSNRFVIQIVSNRFESRIGMLYLQVGVVLLLLFR